MKTFKEQVRRHSVALISLVVALTSLGYNTWRNEETEANRNVRTAGVQLLLLLGELERTVFFTHFDMDEVRGNPRTGWAYVLTIRDLGRLTASPATESSQELWSIWRSNWEGLGRDDAAQQAISHAIDRTREDMLAALAALD